MLNKKPTRILAISPGTREMGVSVLEKKALIYYGVKSLRQGKLPDRVLKHGIRIIERLIDEYEPQVIALEKISYPGSRRSSILHAFCKKIKTVAKERDINSFECLPLLARKIIRGDGKSTKRETAKILTNRYPELRKCLVEPELTREKQKERYWMNVFDAIALGFVCYRKVG